MSLVFSSKNINIPLAKRRIYFDISFYGIALGFQPVSYGFFSYIAVVVVGLLSWYADSLRLCGISD